MKTRELIVIAALGLFAACDTTYRATDANSIAPQRIQSDFYVQYPSATDVVWTNYDAAVVVPVDWDMAGWPLLESDDYAVRFRLDGQDHYAWYDADGTWIGTAYVVTDHATMPAAVTNTIHTSYPGYTISSITRELENNRMHYEVELNNSHTKVKLLLDDHGNIVKTKTKSMDE